MNKQMTAEKAIEVLHQSNIELQDMVSKLGKCIPEVSEQLWKKCNYTLEKAQDEIAAVDLAIEMLKKEGLLSANSAFVVLTIYSGLIEDVRVYKNFDDAKKEWETQTGEPWSEYDNYSDADHVKNDVRVFETKLRSSFETVQKIIVGRPINGVSINGLEYLLNDDGSLKRFNNQAEAEAFLLEKGFSKDGFEDLIFQEDEQND